MKMPFKYIFFFVLIIISCNDLFSQAGMRFPELSKKLEAYYDEELISDIRRVLPQNDNFSIWGWDVGDYSGDGNDDLAISVKYFNDKKKVVQVYLFVDLDGFLTMVGQFPYEYYEMPLEIGVSIRDNACFVTKKNENFDWLLKGYRYDNGALILLDEFHTSKVEQLTYEKYRNYQNNFSSDKYINTRTSATVQYMDFTTLPSYTRGRMIYKGFTGDVFINKPEYVFEGAFYWNGEEDASYSIKSSFDEENLYFTIYVTDDEVVPTRCDSCNGDYVELWFDLYPLIFEKDRAIKSIKDKNVVLRNEADTCIYSLKISPGDFLERKPFLISIKSTDHVEEFQKQAAAKIKAVSSLNNKGYIIKAKIPFEVFGIDLSPEEGQPYSKMGFTAIINDIDNEFRPEETTRIASSNLTPNNPSTYGELILIRNSDWYGEAYNIFHDDIIKVLRDFGF